MKFYNYLTEKKDLDELIVLIKKDCKQYLNDWKTKYKEQFIYSGRFKSKEFIKKQTRENRRPRDIPLDLHKFIDAWFYKNFKIKARSNSVFCTNNIRSTEEYGSPYIIFPIGQYTMISSPKIRDLWQEILFEITNSMWKSQTEEEQKEYLDKLEKDLENAHYQKNKIFFDKEIMLNCKEYYGLSLNHYRKNHIIRKLKE